ncbi:terminase [Clostridium botulinum]|uniref:terminase n=1 Tax=Clostridium botulinum TaxID=1491 RepID=UPI001E2EDBC3|nr:terminase [Clostridium botulinum]MCD3223935.1 terminase [Clostridium botulinum C/D]MCD3296284.1 terminase [Clostridium botulinum C/D]
MKQHVFPDMQFWIKAGDEIFQLPVNPASYEVNAPTMNKTIKIMNFGELSIKGNRALRTWSFSSFFPKQQYNFLEFVPSEPYWYVDILEKARTDKEVCRCVITGTPLNLQCTVEDFKWGEQDGSRDVYFTISFKEWRPLAGCEVRI